MVIAHHVGIITDWWIDIFCMGKHQRLVEENTFTEIDRIGIGNEFKSSKKPQECICRKQDYKEVCSPSYHMRILLPGELSGKHLKNLIELHGYGVDSIMGRLI